MLPLPPRRDDPSEQSMKSILKTMRKKVQTESAKGQWEKDTPKSKSSEEGRGSQEAKADKSHILNPDLTRSRQSRRVDRSVLTTLPALRDANAAVRSQLLVRKVRLCSVVFTFTETPDSPAEAVPASHFHHPAHTHTHTYTPTHTHTRTHTRRHTHTQT